MQNTNCSLNQNAEILINAFRVTHPLHYANYAKDTYEFVLDIKMQVIDCVKILVPTKGIVKTLFDEEKELRLNGLLFELHHVRVNPKIDNSIIIQRLTAALREIGVGIHHQPHTQDMRFCYKPLGEITDCVRFYVTDSRRMIFLCPTQGPRLAYTAG